jgi:hypothetical protein
MQLLKELSEEMRHLSHCGTHLLIHCTNTVMIDPYTVMQVLRGTNVADLPLFM